MLNGCPASGQQSTGFAQFNASFSIRFADAYSFGVIINSTIKLTVFVGDAISLRSFVSRGPG